MLPPIDITYCLIALAAIVWLGMVTVVIGVCLSAARGDRTLRATQDSDAPARSAPARLRLVV